MKLRRSVLHWVCLFALGAVALVGCQEVVHTVELSVTTRDASSVDPDLGGPPLAGVELCETDTTNCETTDGNGRASIRLPANRAVTYTLSKDGYGPYLFATVTTDETSGPASWSMVSDELLADFSDIVGIPNPWTGGRVGLKALPVRAGATYDLVDETAQAVYRDEAGNWKLDLKATTSDGRGTFAEIPPGEYQVEFGGTATNCVAGNEWPGDAANRIRVPVKIGFTTLASVHCD